MQKIDPPQNSKFSNTLGLGLINSRGPCNFHERQISQNSPQTAKAVLHHQKVNCSILSWQVETTALEFRCPSRSSIYMSFLLENLKLNPACHRTRILIAWVACLNYQPVAAHKTSPCSTVCVWRCVAQVIMFEL